MLDHLADIPRSVTGVHNPLYSTSSPVSTRPPRSDLGSPLPRPHQHQGTWTTTTTTTKTFYISPHCNHSTCHHPLRPLLHFPQNQHRTTNFDTQSSRTMSLGPSTQGGFAKEAVLTKNAPPPMPFFSQAVKCGGMVYCSGSIGMSVETGKVVEGSVGDRTVSF